VLPALSADVTVQGAWLAAALWRLPAACGRWCQCARRQLAVGSPSRCMLQMRIARGTHMEIRRARADQAAGRVPVSWLFRRTLHAVRGIKHRADVKRAHNTHERVSGVIGMVISVMWHLCLQWLPPIGAANCWRRDASCVTCGWSCCAASTECGRDCSTDMAGSWNGRCRQLICIRRQPAGWPGAVPLPDWQLPAQLHHMPDAHAKLQSQQGGRHVSAARTAPTCILR
jgi:hypothetical protein